MLNERSYWDPEHETMSKTENLSHQLKRAKMLLEWAYERSSFYQKNFDAVGVGVADVDDFEAFASRVPFITKEAIIAAQQDEPPFGGFLTVPTADLARIFVAPGPIQMPFTAEDFDGMAESTTMALWSAGVRPHDIADVTMNYHWVCAGTWADHAFRKVGCAVVPGGIGNTKMHLDAMRALKVTAAFTFSTFLVQLAEAAKESGLNPRRDLSLRATLIGGELKPAGAIAEIEETFGMKVREMYGTADLGLVGFECNAKAGMHVTHNHVVEILDPVTQQLVPAGNGGEIVATSLTRRAMPIIRYRTGDLVSYTMSEPCPCGRNTVRLGPIVGRVGSIPRVKGMFIVPKQIENALLSFEGLGRFQMVIDRPQIADVLTVRIEAGPEVSRPAIKSALGDALREAIRIRAEIEFVEAGGLPEGTPLVVDNRHI